MIQLHLLGTDPDPESFAWIDCQDAAQSVFVYLRRDGAHHCIVVLNATPNPHDDYRVGVPTPGGYQERLSSDAAEYGGGGYATRAHVQSEAVPWHGFPQSIRLKLPPLGALLLTPG